MNPWFVRFIVLCVLVSCLYTIHVFHDLLLSCFMVLLLLAEAAYEWSFWKARRMKSPPVAMRVTYDAQVDAAYIYLVEIGKGEVKRTKAIAHEGIMLDFNADGALIGIEVLNATRQLPDSVIAMSRGQV